MFPHLLKTVLLHLHINPSVHLLYDEIIHFSPRELAALMSTGILVESSPAKMVICDECERRCSRELEYHTEPSTGITTAFIRCDLRSDMPDMIPIAPERARFWRTSRTRLVAALREFLGVSHPIHEIVPGRFWRLGSFRGDQGRVDVFFAAGVNAKDFKEVWARALPAIQECSQPVLITPSEFAPPKTSGSLRTVSLTRLMSIEGDAGLALDVEEIKRVAGVGIARVPATQSDFRFSEGFASVSLRDKTYRLMRPQAQVIRALYEARENRTPWLHKDQILVDLLESSLERLRDVFKTNPEAWKDLVATDRKGNYRLNID